MLCLLLVDGVIVVVVGVIVMFDISDGLVFDVYCFVFVSGVVIEFISVVFMFSGVLFEFGGFVVVEFVLCGGEDYLLLVMFFLKDFLFGVLLLGVFYLIG